MSIFDQQLSQQQLDSLYNWVDGLPLSRPKKNITRDFSDAVLMAEAIHYYYPRLIEIHNYPATHSIKSKLANWKTLNTKVLSKFGIVLKDEDCQKLASSVPMMIQILLHEFKNISAEEHREKEQMIQAGKEQAAQGRNFQEIGDGANAQDKNRKKEVQLRGLQVTKVQQLKEILKILKQKITFVEKNIQRKDAEIKQLQDIIHLGL